MKTRFSHGFRLVGIAKNIVLQKLKFHYFGVDFVVFSIALDTIFMTFDALEPGLKFVDFHGYPWRGPRSKAPTPVVVICMVAGSLTSTYQYIVSSTEDDQADPWYCEEEQWSFDTGYRKSCAVWWHPLLRGRWIN